MWRRAILTVFVAALVAAAGCGTDSTVNCDCKATCQPNVTCASIPGTRNCVREAQPDGGWTDVCYGWVAFHLAMDTETATAQETAACLASDPNIATCDCRCVPVR